METPSAESKVTNNKASGLNNVETIIKKISLECMPAPRELSYCISLRALSSWVNLILSYLCAVAKVNFSKFEFPPRIGIPNAKSNTAYSKGKKSDTKKIKKSIFSTTFKNNPDPGKSPPSLSQHYSKTEL